MSHITIDLNPFSNLQSLALDSLCTLATQEVDFKNVEFEQDEREYSVLQNSFGWDLCVEHLELFLSLRLCKLSSTRFVCEVARREATQ